MASADITPSATSQQTSAGSDLSRTLQTNLDRLATRRNALRMWRAIARCLASGLCVAVVMVLAYRFYLVDGPAWLPLIPLIIALAIGWRLGTLVRGGAFAAALEADEKLDLKERLSSALAFVQPEAISHRRQKALPASGKGLLPNLLARTRLFFSPSIVTTANFSVASTVLVPSLVEDAAAHSRTLSPREIYPLKFDHTHRVLLGLVLLFTVAALMPNVPWFLSKTEQQQRKLIAEQGEGLVAIAKEVKKEGPKQAQEDAETKTLAKRLETLGHKMMRGRMGKKEALTSLGELKKDLEKATKNDGQNQSSGSNEQSLQQALEQLASQPMDSEAGQKMKEELKKGDTEAAAKELEKMADQLEKGQMSEQEKQKAASDMQKMAKELRKQGGQQNEDMANQLDKAAQALKRQQQQQQQQGKQGGQQGQQGQQQQGQKQGGKQGQQQQQGQNGQKQGQKQQGQKGQGQQGGQSGKQQQGQQQGGNQGASSALRQMARGMRQGAGNSNSQGLQRMLNKIRQAERDTGRGGNSQAGAPPPGNGQFPGGQQGQGKQGGLTPGKDLMPSDPHGPVGGGAGLGPRNHSGGSKSGGGVSNQHIKRTGDKRRWEDIWSDRLPATRKKIDRVQGKYADDGEMEQLPTKTEAKGGPVKTPYYEVYESYHKDAEDAVNKDNVPPAYKQPVKDYFESIKP